MLGAFAFQAVGALAGTVVGTVVLKLDPDVTAWRWMYGVAIVPAALVLAGRFFVTESAPWLFARGRRHDAERETERLLQRRPPYPKRVVLALPHASAAEDREKGGWLSLLDRKNRRATILASVPWFLQDLSTYGIGIFTPTILAATLGHDSGNARNLAEVIQNDVAAAEGAAMIDLLLIVGFLVAVAASDRVGRIPLQILGFIGCAAGLLIASFSAYWSGTAGTTIVFVGFMLFNFMTNLGPNAQTYLIAGEVFPTHVRGKGAGFAAAFGKIGAVLTAFGFPILLSMIGQQALLFGLVAMSLAGAAVTWWFRIETAGLSLDEVGRHHAGAGQAGLREAALPGAGLPAVEP